MAILAVFIVFVCYIIGLNNSNVITQQFKFDMVKDKFKKMARNKFLWKVDVSGTR